LEIGVPSSLPCNEKDLAHPLHFAAMADCCENAELLLLNNADVKAVDSVGNTPMHIAVMNQSIEMVKLLE
jgi:ankyrin repeat protein